MEPNDLERLLPCPFCGGGTTEFHENGRVWAGTKYSNPISVSVRHWCEEVPGPNRMIERIGRDKEQAIERWNMRSNVVGKGRCAELYRAASSDRRERP
jgi:hypothetical protein